ncbi:putative lipid carrier protein YhbT/chorismate mutase [Lysobacter niabensis]|uniref:Ubiquinone biosynthesis accessory factor UbiT n=1 Tax=Agrilutibacter niabensis TaxID=380628 RepID=A0ABU1VNH3_9GAMM|nr:chorismate mutase [Lysobacter niabensis]MDR7099026.1 putative lipid carrier protein YhbT/chorismate mutase [Lysobacter niabensis]
MPAEPPALARVRHAIDRVDDALLLLLAARLRLARRAAQCKRSAGLPLRDPAREARVRARADAFAGRIGLPAATARRAIALAIDDACRVQGLTPDLDQGREAGATRIIAATMHNTISSETHARVLRLLPPPARWATLLRACPPALQRQLLERAMTRVLAAPLASGALAFLQGRYLGIEVTDLALRWVVTLDGERLRAVEQPAQACVRGTATDLLLLAGRLEDADTLFFQRRLVLTGDTELGLTARNLLERLPWEQVPLGLRIALNRGARLAQAARDAHREGAGNGASA